MRTSTVKLLVCVLFLGGFLYALLRQAPLPGARAESHAEGAAGAATPADDVVSPAVLAADDAGHYSFARQIIPTLLGRKPKGYDEIKLVADLSAATDRGTVARSLMDQPEYVEHWSDVIAGQLRIVVGEDAKNQSECFENPLREGGDGGELARWIRDHAPDEGPAPGGPFNMADVLRSALVLDDLSPVYRAYLFAMVSKPRAGNEITEDNKRDDFGVQFSRVFTQRQALCINCHNSETSKTGPESGWNRTHPIPGYFEKALFRTSVGIRPEQRAFAVFRTDVNFGDVQPWGMQGCGSFSRDVLDDELGYNAYFTRALGKRGTVWDLEDILRKGYLKLDREGLQRRGASGLEVDGDAAFAFLVSANIVNHVWAETMGYPLTIPIAFPRNTGQLAVFRELTEFQFVPSRWSLRTLLTRITTSEFYNLRPPRHNEGATAYELPMLFNPWVEADPRQPTDPNPANHFNSTADTIQRYSPRSLLSSVHHSLDWPPPKRFPDEAGYPKAELLKDLGLFLKDAEPGFKGTDFQGLLHWEAVHGACVKPEGVAADWVDKLAGAIPAYDAANPSQPLSMKDVAMTVKDWLVGDSQIYDEVPRHEQKSESELLNEFFGVESLEETGAAGVPELGTKLRRYCGVLLETPQFMLSGVTSAPAGPKPRLRVCNEGPCTYAQMCEALKPSLERLGWSATCEAESVAASRRADGGGPFSAASALQLTIRRAADTTEGVPAEAVADLCPSGLCAVIPWTDNALCERNPALCRRRPPPCDPRCTTMGCCGGPAPPVIDRPVAFLAWAEGGVVQEAKGVRILQRGRIRSRPLVNGAVLRADDLLQIPTQGRLKIKTAQGDFSSPEAGMPAGLKSTYWTFLVTGPSNKHDAAASLTLRANKISRKRVEQQLNTDDMRWGEAGAPVRRGAKREIDVRRMRGQRN